MSKYIVTGCAGFIGSHITDRILKLGSSVLGIDNLSTGHEKFIELALRNKNFKFINIDLIDLECLKSAFSGGDVVIHFAANADVRFGPQNTRKDLEQNTIATYNVLESMKFNGIKKIIFSSTGSVYGEAKQFPTPEEACFPIQTSLYGASKTACEGLISAYCEAFDMQSWIFRFVSILGERYTHGHVYDFYKKLRNNKSLLHVLGDGHQRKSYLYVQDCIDAVIFAFQNSNEKVNIYNLGVDDYCEVIQSITWICDYLQLSPTLEFYGGTKGWSGDNPFIYLDTNKIRKLGWTPKTSIKEGVLKTVEYLKSNEWVFNERN